MGAANPLNPDAVPPCRAACLATAGMRSPRPHLRPRAPKILLGLSDTWTTVAALQSTTPGTASVCARRSHCACWGTHAMRAGPTELRMRRGLRFLTAALPAPGSYPVHGFRLNSSSCSVCGRPTVRDSPGSPLSWRRFCPPPPPPPCFRTSGPGAAGAWCRLVALLAAAPGALQLRAAFRCGPLGAAPPERTRRPCVVDQGLASFTRGAAGPLRGLPPTRLPPASPLHSRRPSLLPVHVVVPSRLQEGWGPRGLMPPSQGA